MVGLRKTYMAPIVSLLPVEDLGKLTSMQVHTDTLDRLHRASQRGESYEQTIWRLCGWKKPHYTEAVTR